jgi:hypothetical protein
MWDSGTGQAIGNPLEGHTALVRSVCGSYDATIRIWSCHTRQLIRTLFMLSLFSRIALLQRWAAKCVSFMFRLETK